MTVTETATKTIIETITAREGWERPQHVGGLDYAAYRAPYGRSDTGRDLSIGVMWTTGGTAVVVDDCGGESVAVEGETYSSVMDAIEAAERIEARRKAELVSV